MKLKKLTGFCIVMLILCCETQAQSILAKNISLDINKQRLVNVLEIISNKADFYFSYNSKMINRDSIVSIKVVNTTVKEVLQQLFNNSYEFKESGNYIIIRKAPIRMILVTQKEQQEEKIYYVSGHVYDEQNGAAVNEASIYEKTILASALTNNDGFFKIKLKSSKSKTAELTVSKELYEDTSVRILPHYNQQLVVTLMPLETEAGNSIVTPEDYFSNDTLPAIEMDTTQILLITPRLSDSNKVEKKGPGRWLLSGKQKVQTINLNRFFTERPYQISFTPWLSTHGKLSGQVVNKFSLNILGGYTAGTNGVEIGGLFNIDKKAVQHVQVAGLFNSVGGRVNGLQVAGINNLVQDTVKGIQVAGVNNLVKGNLTGLQIGGVYNHITDSMNGVQIGGVANFTNKKTTGVQIGGVINVSKQEMNGVQIAGVVNYTRKLKGLQIGLVNIADSSDGFSIGLINIVLKGYHKLSFSHNEALDINVAFKTGNRKLYSILMGGMNTDDKSKLFSYGYGLGSEVYLSKKRNISFNPELSSQYLYMGSWDYTNILNRLTANFTIKLGKYVSVFAGPAFSVYVSNQQTAISGYRFPLMPAGYSKIKFSDKVNGWFGWNAGISFF